MTLVLNLPRRLGAVMALLAAGCSLSPEGSAPSQLPAGPRFITDAQGRALILRGVNVSNSAKNDALRSPNVTDEDIDRIARAWGFNFVRYLVLWDALEPTPGNIDAAYIERIAADVERFGAAGVRVMLDMHQDVYARKFCCDGAPDWAIRDDGQPFELQELWALNYFQPAVERAFDNFGALEGPHTDLQQHYAGVWQALAKRFAGDENVIGYDLMNEPFPGSEFDAAEALFRKSPDDGGSSKRFDENQFATFYERMIRAIRTVDRDHWIFIEPRYGAPANGSPSYLPKLADPRNGEPRIVYAPHLYSSAAEASGSFSAKDQTVSLWEEQRTVDLARQDCPMLLGEWWAFKWEDPNAPAFVAKTLAMADRMQIGWAYWAYDSGPAGGSALHAEDGTDNPVTDLVVRPYPRAIAGEPVAFGFDPDTRTLELTFEQRDGVTGPTELVIPARTYPAGFDVELPTDPSGTVTVDAATGIVSVTTDPSVAEHHVRVVPKP